MRKICNVRTSAILWCMVSTLLIPLLASESVNQQQHQSEQHQPEQQQQKSLAAYYRVLVEHDPAMRRYVSQAVEDPVAFRETVRTDVLERFHIAQSALTEELLQRYVEIETVSMNFMRNGQLGSGSKKFTEKKFWLWWDDDRVVFESKLVPAMIAVYAFPQQTSLAVEILLQRPQTLRTFVYAPHGAFAEISSGYMAHVFAAYLQGRRNDLLTGYVRNCSVLIDAMHFHDIGNISEALALSLKIMSRMSAESRDQHLKALATYVVAHCSKQQQNFFTQSCLQYDLIVMSK